MTVLETLDEESLQRRGRVAHHLEEDLEHVLLEQSKLCLRANNPAQATALTEVTLRQLTGHRGVIRLLIAGAPTLYFPAEWFCSCSAGT